jgi:isoleucyl-tRNA synthetase
LEELKHWAVKPDQVVVLRDLHREFVDEIEVWVDEKRTIKGTRIKEVFDCWVESASMPFAAVHYPFENKSWFEQNYPAQFITEYIAQTRAWFYCMHVISVGLFGRNAFQHALTTGTILAEDGTKMSKSKKNYPDPMVLINKYGVDSLRLYLMSSVVMKADNLNFSEKEVADIRRNVFVIWWNILGFAVQYAKAPSDVSHLPQKPAHVLDRWILSRLAATQTAVTAAFEAYDVVSASRALIAFINECSTWYLRLSRGRLKGDEETTDAQRAEAGQVLFGVLHRVSLLFAPLAATAS